MVHSIKRSEAMKQRWMNPKYRKKMEVNNGKTNRVLCEVLQEA